MMETLHVCPSSLAEGFDTYSPAARKLLFDGKEVSHILPFDSPNNESADAEEYARHVGRISLSGASQSACPRVRLNYARCFLRPIGSKRTEFERFLCNYARCFSSSGWPGTVGM